MPLLLRLLSPHVSPLALPLPLRCALLSTRQRLWHLTLVLFLPLPRLLPMPLLPPLQLPPQLPLHGRCRSMPA